MKKKEKKHIAKPKDRNGLINALIAITVGLAGYIIADFDSNGALFLLFFILTAILIELTNIRMKLRNKL
jgi:hypothetical protein